MLFVSTKKLFLFRTYLNFYSGFFGHVGKRLDKKGKIKLWCHKLVNKQLLYTYDPIFQEVKAIRQSDLVT